jgi:hypothetical protein
LFPQKGLKFIVEPEKNISDELRLLSPVVGNIGRKMPYEAPGGYFDGFSGGVMGLINAEEGLKRFRQLPTYTVPEGYFEGFAQKLVARIKALKQVSGGEQAAAGLVSPGWAGVVSPGSAGPEQMSPGSARPEQTAAQTAQTSQTAQAELEQISPLLSRIDKKTPFEAPVGYFSELLANVVSGVKAIEFVNDELENQSDGFSAPAMSGLKDQPTYQVPEGYFENLATGILAKVKQTAAVPVVPVMTTAPVTAPLTAPVSVPVMTAVPAMGNVPSTVAATATIPARAKVVALRRRRNWVKYSVAAAVAGLICTVGWLGFFNKHTTPTTGTSDIATNLAKVSDQEIQNYLDNHNVPMAESVTNSTVTLDISDSDIKNMLGDVSDDELKEYLDEHGGSRDLATN